jgi:hypothetical protein
VTYVDELLGIESTSQRLRYRCFVIADVIGNLVDAVDLEDRLGNHHFFSKPTRVLIPHRCLIDTDSHSIGLAGPTFAAGNSSNDLNAVSPSEARHRLANFHNFARYFVTDDLRRGESRMAMKEDFCVRAAGRAGMHSNLQFRG